MSFGVGVGDLIAVSRLASDIYRSAKHSARQFREVSAEVLNLRIITEELNDTLSKEGVKLGPRREERLCALLANAYNALHELQQELQKYESLSTDRQKKYDVLQWGFKDVGEIRLKIVSTVTSLNAMGSLLARLEHEQLRKVIIKYFKEVKNKQTDNCDRSIFTTSTVESIAQPENWNSLKAELEEVGLQEEVLVEKQEFITEVVQQAIQDGDLDEADIALARSVTVTSPSVSPSAPPSSRFGSMSSTSIASPLTPPSARAYSVSTASITSSLTATSSNMLAGPSAQQLQRWDTEATLIDEAYQQRRQRTDPASRNAAAADDLLAMNTRSGRGFSKKNGRVVSLALQALGITSDERMIEAADEGDMSSIVKLIRRGADVNAKDKWQWTPLHMAAYGNFPKIAEILILHGADLAARTIDGETPLMLAEKNGYAEVVRVLSEEVERRQRAAELAAERVGLRRESEPILSTTKGKGKAKVLDDD